MLKRLLASACCVLLPIAAFAANASDSLVVTGPNNQQVPIGNILVTPPGLAQTTLGAALGSTGSVKASSGYGILAGTGVLVSGGTGYVVGDSISLTCAGCVFTTEPVITVNHVTATVVDGFTVTSNGVATSLPSVVLLTSQQDTSSGAGTGVVISASYGPIAATLSYMALTSGGGNANGNMFMGAQTPSSTLGGAENTFFGDAAGGAFTGAASANTAFGLSSCGIFGASAPTGSFNTCIGNDSGRNISGAAASNTLLGQAAGRVRSGSFNTDVGQGACVGATTGSNNVCIGQSVGATLLGGGGNILIGFGSDVNNTGGTNNEINIGGFLFYNKSSIAAPSVFTCGTSPSADAHANNRSGTITAGSGTLTSCSVTFAGVGYILWNHCRVTSQSAVASFAYSYTKTVLTVTGASLTSVLFDYDCDGY